MTTGTLDADAVAALRLDPTGMDGDPRFPYTLGKLSDGEVLWLNLLASEAEHYPDEPHAPVAHWLIPTEEALEQRLTRDQLERLSTYAVGYHASLRDLIESAEKDRGRALMRIILARRLIRVTFDVEIPTDLSEEWINSMIYDAFVQFDEPSDGEGGDGPFRTGWVDHRWEYLDGPA